jgi:hypothetical protein
MSERSQTIPRSSEQKEDLDNKQRHPIAFRPFPSFSFFEALSFKGRGALFTQQTQFNGR